MLVGTIRKPGQRGTRRLVKEYGDRLVCIRYRYDPQAKKRYKTAELIIEEVSWQPPPTPDLTEPVPKPRQTPVVAVRIRFNEHDLRRRIKAIGASWQPRERLWYAQEESIRRIGLTDRIVHRS